MGPEDLTYTIHEREAPALYYVGTDGNLYRLDLEAPTESALLDRPRERSLALACVHLALSSLTKTEEQ